MVTWVLKCAGCSYAETRSGRFSMPPPADTSSALLAAHIRDGVLVGRKCPDAELPAMLIGQLGHPGVPNPAR